MKRLNFNFLMFALIAIVFYSCKKDDSNPVANNPTNGKSTAVFNPNVTYGTMVDQDGNAYKTIVIGTQTWMAENLRTTKYRDGTPIPNVTDNSTWSTLTTGAYFTYTTKLDSIATFGRLYNWYTVVDSRNIAPAGWHVPTTTEWITLASYLGGVDVAGGKMKETSTIHWDSPNTGATNESGFTLVGGTSHHSWSSTTYDETNAYDCNVRYDGTHINLTRRSGKGEGISVRLVKD